ncbi:LOW QUALITY PROTEIN: hypothetical protein HID58_002664 [Brassica napus]|uniref:Uncharacterized protein n=1 Tax=Brassica napus TaxID=3708 RepID=A0ABQ8ENZ0_BRANA|nr:LOW QUALITY PROTEIN: hypothetical protein HID58_002664 [Brassica napus]
MAKKKCELCDGIAAASPRRSIATTTARPVGFHCAANPASSSSVIHRCFSSESGAETIAKKKVEDVMPTATGHEKEELEAELENKEQLKLVREEIRVWSLFHHTNLLPLLDHAIISVKRTTLKLTWLMFFFKCFYLFFFFLGVFTLALAFVVGLTCAFTNGKISFPLLFNYIDSVLHYCMFLCVGTRKVILESAILTTVVVLSLTVYTFWAAKRGYDFNFLGPFLFGALIVLIVFAMIQVTPLIPNSMP